MSQCVPNWDLDHNTRPPPNNFLPSQSNSSAPQIPLFDYEVAELTWENGQLALHGLGPPRVPSKLAVSNQWEKPRGTVTGTLESIVNQATLLPTTTTVKLPSLVAAGCNNDLVSWLDHHQQPAISAASATLTNDALVPCSNKTDNSYHVTPTGCIVGSCSGPVGQKEAEKRSSRVARVPVGVNSTSESVTFTNSFESQDNTTSSGLPCTKATNNTNTTADDYDSVSHSKPHMEAGDHEGEKKKVSGKSSSSTKRSRAAAIHNQSERKRRDKINQRMKTLQKLVPNSSKTDKASMLDEVIEYLKQLQAQIQMMNRFNISPMMLPMAMQQQLQTMSMMQQMNMGMGMGMRMNVMDLNSMARPNNIPVLHPNPFMPVPSWDVGSGDRLQTGSAPVMPDPLAAFLACQSQQPMTMDAYSRMAAMYQQLHQQAAFNGSKKA